MEVIAWTYHPSEDRGGNLGLRYVELEELLQTADIVSLHVKLTEQSKGLIGARELELMKQGAIMIQRRQGRRSGHCGGW